MVSPGRATLNYISWKLKGMMRLPGLETIFLQPNVSEILPVYHLETNVLMLTLLDLIFYWCII